MMKVKQLIEILSNYPSNMEVKLYNSLVGDWLDLDLIEQKVYKEKPRKTLELIQRTEPHIKSLKEIKVIREFEFISQPRLRYFNERPETKKDYIFKNILLIQGNERGKKCFDRLGSISY